DTLYSRAISYNSFKFNSDSRVIVMSDTFAPHLFYIYVYFIKNRNKVWIKQWLREVLWLFTLIRINKRNRDKNMIKVNEAHLIKTALLSYHTSIHLRNKMYISMSHNAVYFSMTRFGFFSKLCCPSTKLIVPLIARITTV